MNDDGLRRDYFRLFGISKDEFERRLGKIGFGDCYKLKVMSDGLKVEFSYQKFESATYGLIESRFAAEFKNEIYALRDIEKRSNTFIPFRKKSPPKWRRDF